MGVSRELISKFLIGNGFHVKLRIVSPYSNSLDECDSSNYIRGSISSIELLFIFAEGS